MQSNDSSQQPFNMVAPEIKVIIFDDCPIFVEGLINGLPQNGCRVIASISVLSSLKPLEASLDTSPEPIIFIVGPHVRTRDAFAACRWAKSSDAMLRTVFITSHANDDFVKVDAAFVGVMACVSPNITAQVLTSIFPIVLTGCSLISLGGTQAKVVLLTAREQEVLNLIAQSKADLEVSQLLHISPHTVKAHVKQIHSKLLVNSRSEAIDRAIHRGWIYK